MTLGIAVAYWLIAPRLPNVAEIRDMRLQVPLKVLSADGKLVAVFGETRREPVSIAHMPLQLKQAVIAIEDSRFYDHPGIDIVGIGRAVWLLATTDRDRVPGGSTITQQVARNYFLSPEYSFSRKASEIFLALRLERELSKDEILELYLNKIFFGYRAYGVAAAADFYYGKTLDQLTLAECAMLASIPKFPSSGNPLNNLDRALLRRNYVLQRMFEEGYIDDTALATAQAEVDKAHPHEPPVEIDAPYLAEMVRQLAIERLGNEAMTAGYVVHTTIDARRQEAANLAIREGLIAYDRRHGYRGPEASLELAADSGPEQWQTQLSAFRPIAGLSPALVLEVTAESAQLYLEDGQSIALGLEQVQWARPYLNESARGPAPKSVDQVLQRGHVVRVMRDSEGNWVLAQLPKAQAALVAIDPDSGAIRSLVGGFSFALSKFNRAVQSNRQPGSSFKPFVYSAAFERGFNAASIVNDAPLVFADPSKEDGLWKPQNDNEKFNGPMRLREAMVQSRNLVSVRVLDAIGVRYARDYITRFGFGLDALPENLSLALGSSSVPPLAMARGYATFANGGYLIEPYFVERIEDSAGKEVWRAHPQRACAHCPERLDGTGATSAATAQDLSALLGNAPGSAAAATPAALPTSDAAEVATTDAPVLAQRVLDERNAYLLGSILRDVIRRGTGREAMSLGRHDLAGKTGTSNEHRDAWFSGYNGELVTTVWVGFDDFTSLGKGEFASLAALPIWIGYMRTALEDVAETPLIAPAGIATAIIDPATGTLVAEGQSGVSEVFKAEDIGRLGAARTTAGSEAEQQAIEIF
jgi:penicillin-binding protein 1A